LKASFAFLIHPLVPWQRRLLGVRFRDADLLAGAPSDAVRRVARISVDTALGPVAGSIIGVPDLPGELVADQARALELQVRAGALAQAHGARVIGLGSALAVVAGRGAALADHLSARVTTGHASTAWAATELILQASGDEPVGVLGFTGTVGDAVAGRLAGHREVWVEATGRAARSRAQALGCHPVDREALLARCRVILGASTTGPDLAPPALREGTVLVDLANPSTLEPGPRPAGVVVLAGETLAWPGRVHGRLWGNLWRAFAGYERGTAYACLAEPLAAVATGSGPWSDGRRLDPLAVDAAGDALTRVGFRPVLTARRG
jgi:predicted amino acid dehydrogenase